MPPIKPEIVNMGADYKLMPLDVADAFSRRFQSELSKLRRQVKREARSLKRQTPAKAGV